MAKDVLFVHPGTQQTQNICITFVQRIFLYSWMHQIFVRNQSYRQIILCVKSDMPKAKQQKRCIDHSPTSKYIANIGGAPPVWWNQSIFDIGFAMELCMGVYFTKLSAYLCHLYYVINCHHE